MFSFIVAYRHSDDRLVNLKSILKWVSNFECEIILVESDVVSKIKDDGIVEELNINHIFLENNFPFNKSWCFNVGYKNSKFDKIVFGDADLIMNPESFLNSVNLLDDFDCVNPYSSVIDLTPLETNEYLSDLEIEKLYSIERPGRGETDHQKVPMCGGIIMFKREKLDEISGWCEDFWGWGAEDDAMSVKSKMFLNCENVKGVCCYHLNHLKSNIIKDLYLRNLQIYNYFISINKEQFSKYISDTKSIIGDVEKINKMVKK